MCAPVYGCTRMYRRSSMLMYVYSTCAYMFAYMHVGVYVCMRVYVHACPCMCIHVCMRNVRIYYV